MLQIRKNLTILLLLTISFAIFTTASAQETMTTEERLARLEKAVTNLEEYALLLHYNQIGSVAEFETRIGELERSFSFIVGEVVQLQPAGATTPTAPTPTAAANQPTQARVTQQAQTIQAQAPQAQTPQQTTQVQQTTQAQAPQQQTTQTVAAPTGIPATNASEEELVYLQVGAYNDAASAAAARVEIEKLGYSVYEGPSGQTIRLFLGPFRQSDVDTMKLWLAQQGIDSFVVR